MIKLRIKLSCDERLVNISKNGRVVHHEMVYSKFRVIPPIIGSTEKETHSSHKYKLNDYSKQVCRQR